jgi:hypothetical protein
MITPKRNPSNVGLRRIAYKATRLINVKDQHNNYDMIRFGLTTKNLHKIGSYLSLNTYNMLSKLPIKGF